MEFLTRLRRLFLSDEPTSSLRDPAPWLIDCLGGGGNASGMHVNENSAANLVGVGACVQILADTVASLPLIVYEHISDSGRRRRRELPLYRLLHDAPNPHQSAFTFRNVLQAHLSLWGNAYAEIQRGANGEATALWPRYPGTVTPRLSKENALFYEIQAAGGKREVPDVNMLHILGFSTDGLVGKSPIRMYREAIGLGMALERYGGKFFANGGHVHLWAKHPKILTDKAFKNLRETLEKLYSGLENANRVAVMEEGMELHSLGMPHDDAQFLETRKFQLAEFGRIYRIPLHLLDETDKAATYASVEQFAIMFVVHTVRPINVRWEQELNRKLMPADGSLFCEFLIDGLLRGDQKSRYETYAIGRQNGVFSANDVCRMENLNPVPGGDEYLRPANMVPVGTPAAPKP